MTLFYFVNNGCIQHASEPVLSLMKLQNLLETAQFQKFWKERESKTSRAIVDAVPGFDDSARDCMLTRLPVLVGQPYDDAHVTMMLLLLSFVTVMSRLMSITYQSITTASLKTFLNIVRIHSIELL
jgi:hypothetical protein